MKIIKKIKLSTPKLKKFNLLKNAKNHFALTTESSKSMTVF